MTKNNKSSQLHILIDKELKEEFLSFIKVKSGGFLPHGAIKKHVEKAIKEYMNKNC